jgi:hypothetical protein
VSAPSPETPFKRQSETESICMYCFATIRSRSPETLGLEEELHRRSCFVYSLPPYA